MKETATDLIRQSNADVIAMGAKGSVGFIGTVGALSINDLMGLLVGFLTAIYMLLQIESAWRKRQEAKKKNVSK